MNCILEPFVSFNLQTGNASPCDLFDKQGQLLLAKGMPIIDAVTQQASKHELYALHVEWADTHKISSEDLTKLVLNDKVFEIYSPEIYFHIVNWTQKFCRQLQLFSVENLSEAVEIVDSIFKKITSDVKLSIYVDLFKSYDNYLTSHSINVALLSAIIAKKLDYKGRSLEHLVMGAMLHDIGKLMIPKEILNKPSSLSIAEYDFVKRHPKMGEEILKLVDVHEDVIVCALQHQERWDGKGYPDGLKGCEIHLNAQIIALADVFDAITTIRPYRLAYPAYHAIELIVKSENRDFSPDVVKAFLQSITIYPENSLVKLNTGEVGQVISVPLKSLTRPIVKVKFDKNGQRIERKKLINLSENTYRFISSLNYGGNGNMNIMLIDDDEDCILGLAGAIEPAGYNCEIYTNPAEAVKDYTKKSYDVVITDMKMPQMSGIEVLKAIKLINPNAKIIINTGYGDVETAIAAVNNGAYAFFGKPVSINELFDTLEKINIDVQSQKKVKEEQARLAIEYARLKMAYEDMLCLLQEKTGQRKRGNNHE